MYPTPFRSLCAVSCLFLGLRLAEAAPPCNVLTQTEIPVRVTLASAGFFANLTNAEHSINVQMNSLLNEAHATAELISAGQPPCLRTCTQPVIAVVFESTPHVALVDYDEFSLCQSHYTATRTHPIVYSHRVFSSDEEAKAWYKDLTQGDGPDGEDLYRRCPGSCSPSYSSSVYQRLGHFVVTTSIVCGHARDKDDDQYRLRAALRWVCP